MSVKGVGPQSRGADSAAARGGPELPTGAHHEAHDRQIAQNRQPKTNLAKPCRPVCRRSHAAGRGGNVRADSHGGAEVITRKQVVYVPVLQSQGETVEVNNGKADRGRARSPVSEKNC